MGLPVRVAARHGDQFQTRVSRHTFAPRGAMRPSCAFIFRPLEGVGNAGCPLHPRPRVHFVLVKSTRVTTSTPERPAFPHAMVLTAYVVLSPVTGLFCHRRLADIRLVRTRSGRLAFHKT